MTEEFEAGEEIPADALPPATEATDEETEGEEDIGDTDIVFDCPHCGHNLVIDYRGAGLQINCAKCGQAVSVPIPEDMSIDDLDVEPGEILKQLFKTRRMLRDAEGRIVELEAELEAAGRREMALGQTANSVAQVRLELGELARSMASSAARMAELISQDDSGEES